MNVVMKLAKLIFAVIMLHALLLNLPASAVAAGSGKNGSSQRGGGGASAIGGGAVVQCLGQRVVAHHGVAAEVRDGSRHPEHPEEAPSAEVEAFA